MSSREKSRAPSKAAIEAMIEEATVDAYGEAEQAMGWQYVLDENLGLPFTTKVLGMEVGVERIELRDDNTIVAICTRGRERQAIALLDLPLPKPPPAGWEWIAAYRCFSRGARS
jgi:hypothetical protein